ncbi:MAG: hypothetical protein ABEJ06_01805 [Haloarculaceae archaeon]
MDPTPSRRQLLAGGAALSAGLVGGVAVAPAKWLPGPVARERAELRPVPELDVNPPVSTAHADAGRAALQDVIGRAERAVERVPADATPPGIVEPAQSLDSARDYATDAEGATWEALGQVRLGATAAGRAIGAARVMTGEASGQALAARARDIQSRIEAVRDGVDYEVGSASAGLARLYWVERLLALGYLNSYRDGTYAGQDDPTTEYDDRDVVSTWASHHAARRYVDDATWLARDYRVGLDETTALRDHVETAERALRSDARACTPDAEEFDRVQTDLDAMEPGPYRTFRGQVFAARQNADVRRPRGPWAGVALYRAVENAETVLTCRGCDYAREQGTLDPGESVSGTTLATAKREGLRLLARHRRAGADRPLLAVLLREPRRLLWAGDLELKRRGRHDVDHPAARAYATYLRAVGYLRAVPEVTARLDRPDS